jgi:glycosyltransferase involved in cell wall biosynthesis
MFTVLIPSFNDWDALRLLLPRIDRALADTGRVGTVLIVDDASTEMLPSSWPDQIFRAIRAVEILHLRCNLGHQRAIALGLHHIHEFSDSQAVIVMDGDGEDRAEDLPALLDEFERASQRDVVFAARAKRMESLAFQCFYRIYQFLHRVLTGIEVRVGNFSVMPRAAVARVIASPDLWNHYAAAVYRAKISRRLLPLPRGKRLTGTSKMNFVSLLMHGLSAMAVFSDQVSARLLTASAGFSIVAVVGSLSGQLSRQTTGWLIVLMFQVLTFAILFAFLIARARSSAAFNLQRDAPYFILGKTSIGKTSDVRDKVEVR